MSEIKYAGGTQVFQAAIPLNGTLSSIVTLGPYRLLGIHMPGQWGTAVLTFQASWDGDNFFNVYTKTGDELVYTVDANRWIVCDPVDFVGIPFLKIRSGTNGSPAGQNPAVTFNLIAQRL